MYVCVCKAVTDNDIRRAADGGVKNLRQLSRETGCSSQCGQCAKMARSILSDAIAESNESLQFMTNAQMA